MILYEDPIWQEDLEKTILATNSVLSDIAGARVVITGATGLIGSALADLLIKSNACSDSKIEIILAGRSYEKARRRFGTLIDSERLHWTAYNADKPDQMLDTAADYIIHTAGNAYPSLIMKEPVETMQSNFIGLMSLLESAKKHSSKRVLYISSSEVYGKSVSIDPLTEDEYGYINLLNPRNSYSVAKRAAETLCASYSLEYGVDSVIVRPGHIYGPTASMRDNRVSSAFAYQAARGESIVLKSAGTQRRSYCYCLDCASAILSVLVKGASTTAYNISNRDSIISIREMAQYIADAANVSLAFEVPTETEKKAFSPMDNSSLDASKLEALGWKAQFGAAEGFRHTVQILKNYVSI